VADGDAAKATNDGGEGDAAGDAVPPVDAGSDAPSCAGAGDGLTNCGISGAESCCISPLVKGGHFSRSYDGVYFTDAGNPAQVSDFRLDRYTVTVARFGQFVDAVIAGWRPAAGAGTHAYLNGGNGLNSTSGNFETGWNASWNSEFPTTLPSWTNALSGVSSTWTAQPGVRENLPIVYETWFEAYAFCIWDGGFLPSESEWNYAAAGGNEQRTFPWSVPATSATVDCAHANYAACDGGQDAVGSKSPAGDGLWAQTDLTGNVWQWLLDAAGSYVNPCEDCANVAVDASRVRNGGSFHDLNTALLSSARNSAPPTTRYYDIGVRCARSP
jgi:formylglycine-generating enzyme required for sulfatase activity